MLQIKYARTANLTYRTRIFTSFVTRSADVLFENLSTIIILTLLQISNWYTNLQENWTSNFGEGGTAPACKMNWQKLSIKLKWDTLWSLHRVRSHVYRYEIEERKFPKTETSWPNSKKTIWEKQVFRIKLKNHSFS